MSDAAIGELAVLITVIVLGGVLIYLFDRWETAIRQRAKREKDSPNPTGSDR